MTRPAQVAPLARERAHTLYFLDGIRAISPVFLDTEVDMSAVLAHRAEARAEQVRYSVVTYVLHEAARVLVRHPEANVAIARGRWRSRLARYDGAHGKLTLDRTLGGQRVVLSAVLPDLDSADLDTIQSRIDYYRDGDPEVMPEFAGVRTLHRLPRPVGAFAFRRRVGGLGARAAILGTFAVTSLGHRPVDGFHSVGGTTITLGVGRIAERPTVQEGRIVAAPLMRLNLAFDHRAIDGALAADVLAEIKEALEHFGLDAPRPHARAAEAGLVAEQ
ncbi:pyruvate/2-oxoglutarate dehydrogenase complex dihydrolipoamide acyltransferase (E2) component [Catenulispora sp. GAS73]|uniref:2-oxo acid dehydrogenase subunit E2 n=1 Tax=Catenulispora sp. GAS73 TaxID=3156269 RepID=UPI0035166B0A